MKRTALIAAALLTSTAAHAFDPANIEYPPVQYDHAYSGQIHLSFQKEPYGHDKDEWGWSQLSKDGKECWIFLTEPGTVIKTQQLTTLNQLETFLHERAHCNGWKHPGQAGKHQPAQATEKRITAAEQKAKIAVCYVQWLKQDTVGHTKTSPEYFRFIADCVSKP
jgi:hypothetical protein